MKIFKTKGLDYYVVGATNKREAAGIFLVNKIGVTENDIVETDEYPQTGNIFSTDDVVKCNQCKKIKRGVQTGICEHCGLFGKLEKHSLKGIRATRQVFLNGEELTPEQSQKHHNHSPDGFNWGYGGSGPAQLALAVILKLGLIREVMYQRFKFDVIAGLPGDEDFEIEFEI